MKAASILLLLLVWHTSFSQFNDSFLDGDYISNPAWSGSTADFLITNNMLVLAAEPASGKSFLTTPSLSINEATWEFHVRLDFNPSSSNYAEIYLATNKADLNSVLEGYLVRIGWTSDNVCLMRQDGSEKTVLIQGDQKRLDLSRVNLAVRVTRSSQGEWRLYSMIEGEADWFQEGETADLTYYKSDYFGIKCNYTSTRSDKFSFDDFVVTGQPFVDQIAPETDTLFSISENKLKLIFSEEITNVNKDNFMLNGARPLSALVAANTVELEMANALFVNNILEVIGLEDVAGNVMNDSEYKFIHYSFLPNLYGDIVFNEVLPDPTPVEDLPATEYIEIINSSSKAIYMTKWSLSDRSTDVVLPDIKLLPDSIIVLYKINESIEWEIDNVVGLPKWPSLNNSGDELWLRDSSQTLVDALTYDVGLFGDDLKQEGGWSLERFDPYLPCTGSINWTASVDHSGGTPGNKNSVFERIVDNEPPIVYLAIAEGPDSVRVFFSEPLGDLPDQIEIDDIAVFSINFDSISLDQIVIKVSPLQPRTVYTITIHDFADCSGNMTEQNNIELVLPEQPEPGDLVINEILFNPKEDLHDYLELLNQSPKYISLEGLGISNGDNEKQISIYNIIAPGEYRVLSPYPNEIIEAYLLTPEQTIIENDLPQFANTQGVARLISTQGNTLDSISYDEDWHFAYLKDLEGVALERISPLRPGLEKSNWASASAQHNYGTPGYVNSQLTNPKSQNILNIEPKVVVPDADGRDDFTTITLNLNESALATLRIYNLHGMEIRTLANSEMIAGESHFTWDGTDLHGIPVPLGHYIIVADLVLENGGTAVFREKMVVGTGY